MCTSDTGPCTKQSEDPTPGKGSGETGHRQRGVTDSEREAKIAQHRGEKIGVCIVLTVTELRALGVDTESANTVRYWVSEEDGQLKFALREKKG